MWASNKEKGLPACLYVWAGVRVDSGLTVAGPEETVVWCSPLFHTGVEGHGREEGPSSTTVAVPRLGEEGGGEWCGHGLYHYSSNSGRSCR